MMDLAAANAILKEDYLGPLRNALNVSTPVLSRLEKNERDIVGKEAWIPIQMGLNQGAGARAENAVLPSAGENQYKEAKVSLKHYYGAMQVSGPVLRQTAKGDKGSFGRVVDLEAKGLKSILSLVLAHNFYLGHRLAFCAASGPSTTVTLEAGTNMEYFYVNMLVDIGSAASSATSVATARTVTAVNKAAGTIVISGAAVTTIATDLVIRSGTFGACVTPLEDIVDDTTDIYGITTATFGDSWKALVNAAFGAFTTTKLQLEIDRVVVASGKMPTALISNYTLQRKYWETLTANPRYVQPSPPKVLDGGFRTLEYSGGGAPMPWIADRLCPAQTIYALHEPDLQVYSPMDFDFLDIGGDNWLPDILGSSAKDNFKAVLWRDIELGAFNRNSHSKMKAVT
jgi:hypothetical protein